MRGRPARGAILAVTLALVALGIGSFVLGQRVLGAPNGADLYGRNCAQCHGAKGGRVPAAPLDQPVFTIRLGEAGLYKAVAEGKATMPAWGRQRGGPLNDAEIRALVGYLLSTERAGPSRALYQQYCATCHGDQGNRVPAAPLNSRQFLEPQTDQDLARAIADGKGVMPAFGRDKAGPLSDDDVAALVGYLRSMSGVLQPGGTDLSAPAFAGLKVTPSDQAATPGAGGDKGQALFKQNCSGCHAAPPRQPDQAQAQRAISEGDATRGMPAFGGRLSNDDVATLAQFVASGQAPAGGGSNPFVGIVQHVDGWLVKHPTIVKDSGTALCSRCHQPSFCVNCHTAGRVKP